MHADFCVKYCGYDLHIENEEVHPIYHLQVVGSEGEKQDLFVSSQELNAGKWHKKIGFLIQLRSAKKLNVFGDSHYTGTEKYMFTGKTGIP